MDVTVEVDVTAAQDRKTSGARGEAKPAPPDRDAGAGEHEPAADADQGHNETAAGRRKGSWVATHKLATVLIVLLALAAAGAGVAWRLNARHYADTDDAFIDARPSAISAEVAAAIVDVPVTDNQVVQAGQPLLRLDDRDYRAAQAQARAQVAQAAATISSAEAQTVVQQATINQMSLEVTQAQAAMA